MKRVLIVAGDPSGDLVASQLVTAMRGLESNLEVVGVGGARLRAVSDRFLTDIVSQHALGFAISPRQINWKPAEREWSIGQCFDHLLLSNRPYEHIIREILERRRRPRLWERLPFLPRLFGRLLIKTLRPDSGRRVKARPSFLPSASDIDPAVTARFLEQQARLLDLMAATRDLDLEGITITSPVVGFVTYSLLDAYRIVVVHEQNHFVQATRVTMSPGFPEAATG